MVLAVESYGLNAGEWACRSERQWKQRTRADRKAKEETDKKDKPRKSEMASGRSSSSVFPAISLGLFIFAYVTYR